MEQVAVEVDEDDEVLSEIMNGTQLSESYTNLAKELDGKAIFAETVLANDIRQWKSLRLQRISISLTYPTFVEVSFLFLGLHEPSLKVDLNCSCSSENGFCEAKSG